MGVGIYLIFILGEKHISLRPPTPHCCGRTSTAAESHFNMSLNNPLHTLSQPCPSKWFWWWILFCVRAHKWSSWTLPPQQTKSWGWCIKVQIRRRDVNRVNYTFLFKLLKFACLFAAKCLSKDVVFLCVFILPPHMYYALVVLSSFLPV